MFITRLRLKNWRNFREVDVALRERMFIVGANASGKSNLLDAVRFLRDLAREGGGLQTALTQRSGLTKVRCLAARAKSDVEIDIELGERGVATWRYAIGIRTPKGKKSDPVLSYEKVWHDGKVILERPDKDDEEDVRRLTQTHLEQINANVKFREIADFFADISYRHLVPQMVRSPNISVVNPVELEAFGSRFIESVLHTDRRMRDTRLKRIEKALQQAVPQLRELKVVRDAIDSKPHFEAVYQHWRPRGAYQREDQFSDGTLRMIGLFWALLDRGSTLLLEEPEISLHQEIVDQLPALIHKIRQGLKGRRQVLVTTHNFAMLQHGVAPEEVLLLEPTDEGTEVKPSSDDSGIVELVNAGIPVGEAVEPSTRPHVGQLDLAFQ